jgi:hypothetical protein
MNIPFVLFGCIFNKSTQEIEKPVLIFTVPTSSMLQKQKKDYQLNKIPSLENDEGSGSSSTRKRKIVEVHSLT